MIFSVLLGGLMTNSLIAVLVGLAGARRTIGFGWAYLISVIFTPIVGLIFVLLSDPLPLGMRNWGCLGTLMSMVGASVWILLLLLLLLLL